MAMGNTPERSIPVLGTGSGDHVAAILRAVAAAVPLAGGVIAEAVNYTIPSTRMQRVENYLTWLSEKLSGLEEATLRERFVSPENIDLLEDGARQAARALSDERVERLARLVADGIRIASIPYVESRRVLRLLEELDDIEVIILASFLQKNSHDAEFRQKHGDVLYQKPAHLGSSQSELDADVVHNFGRQRLMQLGLLNDARSYVDITPLGRLLLRRIGLAEHDDF